jgi:hypothetical protein
MSGWLSRQSSSSRTTAWIPAARGRQHARLPNGPFREPCPVDSCRRPWTPVDSEPVVPACVDSCGHPWTRLGDLRIRRLGVRVAPGALRETPGRSSVGKYEAPRTCDRLCHGSDPREPFSIRIGASRAKRSLCSRDFAGVSPRRHSDVIGTYAGTFARRGTGMTTDPADLVTFRLLDLVEVQPIRGRRAAPVTDRRERSLRSSG